MCVNGTKTGGKHVCKLLASNRNAFADCFCAVHTHQLKFANTSLPTLVCRVKAALNSRHLYTRFLIGQSQSYDVSSANQEQGGKWICRPHMVIYARWLDALMRAVCYLAAYIDDNEVFFFIIIIIIIKLLYITQTEHTTEKN